MKYALVVHPHGSIAKALVQMDHNPARKGGRNIPA
jgi:hypothetical protein